MLATARPSYDDARIDLASFHRSAKAMASCSGMCVVEWSTRDSFASGWARELGCMLRNISVLINFVRMEIVGEFYV